MNKKEKEITEEMVEIPVVETPIEQSIPPANARDSAH